MKKRIVAIGLCVVMAFSMTACGKSGKKSSSGEVKNTATSSDEDSSNSEADMTGTKYAATVTLPDYKSYTVAQSIAEVSDEDKEKVDYNLLSASIADTTNIGKEEGTVEDGDVVNIDYVGKMNGEEFSGGSSSDYILAIGSDTFIDGFEDGIIGHSTGETFDLELTWPDDYTITDDDGNETDVSGQSVTFTVTLNYIASLTDDYIKDNQELVQYFLYRYFSKPVVVTNIDEYREVVNHGLEVQNIIAYLFEYLVSESDVERNDVELQEYISDIEAQYQTYADSYGTDLETVISTYTGYSSVEEYETYLTGIYDNIVIMMAVADQEGIEITEEEYEDVVNSMIYISQGQYEDIASFEEDYAKQDTVDDMIYGEVYYTLAESATVVEDSQAMIQPNADTETETTAE